MKEIIIKHTDAVKNERQFQVENKKVFVGSEVLNPGHRCFEINESTLEIKEADVEYVLTFHGGKKGQVITKDGFLYVTALNKKNALKVYMKGGRNYSKPFLTL